MQVRWEVFTTQLHIKCRSQSACIRWFLAACTHRYIYGLHRVSAIMWTRVKYSCQNNRYLEISWIHTGVITGQQNRVPQSRLKWRCQRCGHGGEVSSHQFLLFHQLSLLRFLNNVQLYLYLYQACIQYLQKYFIIQGCQQLLMYSICVWGPLKGPKFNFNPVHFALHLRQFSLIQGHQENWSKSNYPLLHFNIS